MDEQKLRVAKLSSARANASWPLPLSTARSCSRVKPWGLPFFVVLVLGLGLRLYGIGNPLLDSHAERQTQVAMVARNLYLDGMNITCTRLDIFGNDRGCVLLEFPIIHALAALLYYMFGEHEVIGRLISLAFSIGAVVLMHRLALLFLQPVPALAATGLYAISPLNIYFSRAFMAESSMMFFSIAAVYFILRYLEEHGKVSYVGAIFAAALAFLAKTTAVVVLAPILCAWIVRYGSYAFRRVDLWAYLVSGLAPITMWSIYASYINHQNAAIPSSWQLESIVTGRGGLSILIDPVFYLNMGRSIVGTLLTPLGFVMTILGAFQLWKNQSRILIYVWLSAVILSFVALAGANTGHVYYQLPLLPVAALLAGFGVERVLELCSSPPVIRKRMLQLGVLLPAGALVLVGHMALYYYFFSYMYNTKVRMPYAMEVARIIQELTPPAAILILNQPVASTTVLTYYSQRKSWNFSVAAGHQAVQELEDLRGRGATTYVAIDTRYASGVAETKRNEVFWRYLENHYAPIALSNHYIIVDLTKPHMGIRSQGDEQRW